jgi:hypothetical protein
MRIQMTTWRTFPKVLPFLVVSLGAFALHPAGSDAATATVRIGVFDDTENVPLPRRAEIWIRGLGSWWIAQESVKNVPNREVGVLDTIYIYPDGRSGKELTAEFKMTAEMCPQGCARDLISVAISDTHVAVHGTPIRAATGEFEVKLDRR